MDIYLADRCKGVPVNLSAVSDESIYAGESGLGNLKRFSLLAGFTSVILK